MKLVKKKKKCVTYVFSLFVNEIRTDIENDHGCEIMNDKSNKE